MPEPSATENVQSSGKNPILEEEIGDGEIQLLPTRINSESVTPPDHYMLVLDERSLYFSLTPEDDLGLVKSLKVGRSVPDLVYDVGIDIQSYVPSPAWPIEPNGIPRWPRLGYFKSDDFVRYCQCFIPGDAVSTGTEHGRFVRYRKPHAGLPMCEVMVGKVLHIIREYLLEPVV